MTRMLWATATMAFLSPRRLTSRRYYGREVAVAFADGAAGTLHERRAQCRVGEAGAAAQALAGTLVVARAEAGPGGGMVGGREARHVDAQLGGDHLGGAARDSGNRIKPGEGVGVHGGERLGGAGGGGVW